VCSLGEEVAQEKVDRFRAMEIIRQTVTASCALQSTRRASEDSTCCFDALPHTISADTSPSGSAVIVGSAVLAHTSEDASEGCGSGFVSAGSADFSTTAWASTEVESSALGEDEPVECAARSCEVSRADSRFGPIPVAEKEASRQDGQQEFDVPAAFTHGVGTESSTTKLKVTVHADNCVQPPTGSSISVCPQVRGGHRDISVDGLCLPPPRVIDSVWPTDSPGAM